MRISVGDAGKTYDEADAVVRKNETSEHIKAHTDSYSRFAAAARVESRADSGSVSFTLDAMLNECTVASEEESRKEPGWRA
jgi:hypothetical protein